MELGTKFRVRNTGFDLSSACQGHSLIPVILLQNLQLRTAICDTQTQLFFFNANLTRGARCAGQGPANRSATISAGVRMLGAVDGGGVRVAVA